MNENKQKRAAILPENMNGSFMCNLSKKIGQLEYDKKYAETHIEKLLELIKKDREMTTTFYIEGYLESLLKNLKHE